jgi:glycosyltransferase involved in cell wall biosynthesis
MRVVAVSRPGDVNRHAPRLSTARLRALVSEVRPDVVDLHEEPFSRSARAWLQAVPPGLPVVAYTAQNVDKRFPPPFAHYERSAYTRLCGVYPCSSQAASVAWGKGFRGQVAVLPLGLDLRQFRPGHQHHDDARFILAMVGRVVPEKGVLDAVHALSASQSVRDSRLVLVGEGPALPRLLDEALALGVGDRVDLRGSVDAAGVAGALRSAHVLLAPSHSSRTWVEQFGRMAIEAQACGAVVAGYASGALPEATGGAALLVNEGDVTGLQHTVRRLASSPDDWEDVRRAGLRHAAIRSWDAVARRHLDLYERVVRMDGSVPAVPPDSASRAEARVRFGPPSPLGDIDRPFADPLLRRTGRLQQPLGRAVDAAMTWARAGQRRSTSS